MASLPMGSPPAMPLLSISCRLNRVLRHWPLATIPGASPMFLYVSVFFDLLVS